MASLTFSSSLSTPAQIRRLSAALPPKPPRKPRSVQAKIREIFMPALSSTMTEGKIVTWIKSEGDVLSKGESVIVVESGRGQISCWLLWTKIKRRRRRANKRESYFIGVNYSLGFIIMKSNYFVTAKNINFFLNF